MSRLPARRRPAAGWLGTLALAALAAAAPGAAAGDGCLDAEPVGYRLSDYRAPTPCSLTGARVATTADVRRLAAGSALLVDVLPSPRRPESLADELWAPPPHESLPGSVWLPNTGFGDPPVEEVAYLRDNLERLTAGDRSRTLVFYCEWHCWMSWNAARRAIGWGYTEVVWYPDGTDGWREAGLPLVDSEPVPRGPGH